MESKEQSFYIAVILYESSSNNPGYKPLPGMLCSNQSLFSEAQEKLSHAVKRCAIQMRTKRLLPGL